MVNTQAHGRLAVEAANLRLAMESRAVIEQAKGLIMSQRHVTAEQAFEVLREASMRYNRKAFFKQIRRSALAQCQLSVRLTDADGRTIRRPPGS
jgi:AmiR/NasT family two-component response regulator